MANIHQNFSCHAPQIYKFKVHNINCCEECPKKLEQALKKLDGIESVEVDATQNLVLVEGFIDSKEVIDKIKKWWRKKVELVPEREDTNPHGYTVDEVNDEDEGEKEDLFNASGRHQDSSFRHEHEDSSFRQKDSSARRKDFSTRDSHEDSSFRQKDSSARYRQEDSSSRQKDSSARRKDSSTRHKNIFSRMLGKNKGSSNAAEKNDNSESNASSQKKIPDNICTDEYCTFHRRDNYTSDHVPNMNSGSGNPPLYRGSGSYNYPTPLTYAPRPQSHRGQFYGQRMVPPMAGYGNYATQRQMPRPMPNGFTGYSTDEYRNGCNNM